MKGWHFVGETLRDGSPIPPDGEWLEHVGEVEMCRSGLHFSERPIDALKYAPGTTLCRVEVRGVRETDPDKGVCTARKIIYRLNAEPLLQEFARLCALDVIHLWDAPPVVVKYLRSGDELLRAAARDAARAAAGDSVRSAAWATVRATARDPVRSVAWAAAGDAAEDAAGDAAGAAARDAQNKHLRKLIAKELKQ